MIAWIGIIVGVLGSYGSSMAKYQPGKLPAITAIEKEMGKAIEGDLKFLTVEAGVEGERNAENYENLSKSADWIEGQFKEMGYSVSRQSYEVKTQNYIVDGKPYYKEKRFHNIEAEKKGSGEGIVILGAHYDAVGNSPGGDDNGSGVAVMLEAARVMAKEKCRKTIRFVAFTNEEPPFFQSADMGSLVYAKMCRERKDKIEAMVCLDTVGYFTDVKGSQTYPISFGKWLYGDRGNYLAFVGNLSNQGITEKTARLFRDKASINCERAVLPDFVREVGFSDQWSFWQMGYPGVMVTDTAFNRSNTYHTTRDTMDRLKMDDLGRVGVGILGVMRELAGSEKK